MNTTIQLFRNILWAKIALLTVCSSAIAAFEEPPVVEGNPNKTVPLAAVLKFSTQSPSKGEVKITTGEREWKREIPASDELRRSVPLIGLYPDREHTIVVSLTDKTGKEYTSAPISYRPPALPAEAAEFPAIELKASFADEMEPGYRLFNPRRRVPRDTQAGNDKERKFGESFGMLLMVDQQGHPVWYYRTDTRIAGFEYIDDGTILYTAADNRLVRIDMLGNVLGEWVASQRPQGASESGASVNCLTLHHDADLLPNGNLLAISTYRRRIQDYYTSEYEENAPRKDQWVMGDRVIEFSPDGQILWEWNAFEHLPVRRIGYETFSSYWKRRGFPDTIDWSHANEITKRDDGSVMINFRYLSAIVCFEPETGEIRWIFGEPSGWPEALQEKLISLEDETRWPWHQHAPSFTSRGTLLLFDNGNYRAHPFEDPAPVTDTWSRAVEYEFDETAKTARQVWSSEMEGEPKVVTIAMGSASPMPKTGNVIVGYGAILDPDRVDEITWETRSKIGQVTRVREYSRTDPPRVVWDLRLLPTGSDPKIGWNLFGCAVIPE